MAAQGAPPEAGIGPQAKQANLIKIEADVLEDKRPGIVPLFTNMKDLPPPPRSGRRNEQADKGRYNKFECDLEDKYFERIRLPRERQTIVRDHASMNAVVDEMTRAINKYSKEPLIVCGLDTEKEGATIQLSIRLQDFYGEGRELERNVLFQTRSKNGTDIFAEGRPLKLKEFLENGRLVFTGKAVMPDISKAAALLGIDPKVRDEFKYIELEELFDFTMHVLTGYHQAGRYLRVNHGCSDEKNKSRTCLGEVSLKTICRFAWETMTLRKLDGHRNQFNNFDEWKGPMSEELEEYGALDSCVSLACCYTISNDRLGLAPFHFMRRFKGPHDELCCHSLYRILEALDRGEVDSLEKENRGFAHSLKVKVDGDLDLHFCEVIDQNRRWAYKRRLATAELRKERAKKDYDWVRIPVLPATVRSKPMKPSRTPAVPAEDWDAEVDTMATAPPPTAPLVTPAEDDVPVEATNDEAVKPGIEEDSAVVADLRVTRRDEFLIDVEGLDVEDCEVLLGGMYDYVGSAPLGKSPEKQSARQPVLAASSPPPSPPPKPRMVPVPAPIHSASSTSCSSYASCSSNASFKSASSSALLPPSISTTEPTASHGPFVPAHISAPSCSSSPITEFKPPRGLLARRGPRPTPLGRNSPSASRITRVVDEMIRARDQDFSSILRPFLTDDVEKSAEFCYEAVTRMHRRVPNRNLKNKLVASFTHALSGRLLSRVVARVLANNAFGKGRIHAVSRMGYFLVDSTILLDFFFCRVDLSDLATLAKSYSKSNMSELVQFTAGNYLQPDVILARMSGHEFFASVTLEEVVEGVTAKKVQKMITFICKEADIDIPPGMRRVELSLYLEPSINSYIRFRTEPRDFYVVYRDLTQEDPQLEQLADSAIRARCAGLAAYVTDRKVAASSSASSSDELAPECEKPYNKKLHGMCSTRDFIVKSTRLSEFEKCLDGSAYVAMDFHTNMGLHAAHGPLSLITFRFKHKAAFFIPNLFPEVIPPMVRLLRAYARPALTYRWDQFRKDCQKVLGWIPDIIHDVADVTGEQATPFNRVTHSVTGGDFCGRASHFVDSAIPSTVALRHRSMRAAVVYEFVSKELSLEDACDAVDRVSRTGKRDGNDGRKDSRDCGKRTCYTDRR